MRQSAVTFTYLGLYNTLQYKQNMCVDHLTIPARLIPLDTNRVVPDGLYEGCLYGPTKKFAIYHDQSMINAFGL